MIPGMLNVNEFPTKEAAINTAAATGATLYFPPGVHAIETTHHIPGGMRFLGAGRDTSIIYYTGTTGDLFNVQTTAPIEFASITLQGQLNAIGGALVKIAPVLGMGNFRSVFRDVNFVDGWNAIEATAAHSWLVEDCHFSDIGDHAIIAGNSQNTLLGRGKVTGCTFAGLGTGTAIKHISGSTLHITENFFINLATGYHLEWNPGPVLGGDLFVSDNHFSNLTTCMYFDRISGEFANLHISNNLIHGKYCIVDNGAPANWLYDVIINGNGIFPVTDGFGVSLNVNPFTIVGNIIDGGLASNTVGINIGADALHGVIANNLFTVLTRPLSDNAVGPFIKVTGNMGLPVSASAHTVGTSPAAIQAGHRPETLYFQPSGDIGISQDGQTIAANAGLPIPITVRLEPNESIDVVWMTNAPTYTKVIH